MLLGRNFRLMRSKPARRCPESPESCGAAEMIALVRLLARQAAAEAYRDAKTSSPSSPDGLSS